VASQAPISISTVGHSTHPINDFIGILRAHGIRQLVDVRTMPRSRRVPQFNREALAASLQTAGILYRHMPGLGGLRHPKRGSINTGWRNASFRGYADYMQTQEFHKNLEDLIEVAAEGPTAIMCAEAVPWRCHRSLIADALIARGIQAMEILSAKQSRPHALTAFAHVSGIEVTYPAASSDESGNLKLNLKLNLSRQS
jgi:uncharacterized protein (DUF488 family)